MLLLTTDNIPYECELALSQNDNINFMVLDYSNSNDADFFSNKLLFLERFTNSVITLQIGNAIVNVPGEWYIAIGESEIGDVELIPISSIINRGFSAFAFNPINGFMPSFVPIDVINILPDGDFIVPKLESNTLLAIPFTSDKKPLCFYIGPDVPKSLDLINYSNLW